MSTRLVDLVPGEFFHVYNRGNSKQLIFADYRDYERFQKSLYIANSTRGFEMGRLPSDVYCVDREDLLVHIGAYALMPNHFHLVMSPAVDNGLSLFMHKLSTSYSKYFNKKYERTGALFEGKFKAEHIADDVYLKYLFSYVHLNPLKIKYPEWREKGVRNTEEAKRYLGDYSFSSFHDYTDVTRKENAILERKSFPLYFTSADIFKKEVFGWFETCDPNSLVS
jgi:putative transposase